ncbi:MAG: hypothetical protein NTU47_11320 [Ignavibacteriales bacterium]|nr:hypothetical protein [Ignavibacteriales bacterium]
MKFTRQETFVVAARNPQWQFSRVSLGRGETAQISAAGMWGVVDPANHGLTGPGGIFSPAGQGFYKPGAPEGCLLILTGNGDVLHFNSDTDTITIRVPGPLHFVANDDRAPDFPAQKGFDDNIGSMTVNIRIL